MSPDTLARIREGLITLVERPGSNLVAASLAFALAVLLILTLAVLVLLLLARGPRSATVETIESTRAELGEDTCISDTTKARWHLVRRALPATIAAVLLIAGGAVGFRETGRTAYCASSCHTMVPAATSWRTSSHRSIACVTCHEDSPIDAALSRTRHLARFVASGGELRTRATVSSMQCMRCHPEVATSREPTTAHGLRVVHVHFNRAGTACTDCHIESGHVKDDRCAPRRMASCLVCHDGARAPSECDGCHLDDAGRFAVMRRTFGPARIRESACEACHR